MEGGRGGEVVGVERGKQSERVCVCVLWCSAAVAAAAVQRASVEGRGGAHVYKRAPA